MDGNKVNRLDNPQPSLFIYSKEEGSQTVRREVFLKERLKRQSVPERNLSSMWRNLLGGNACRGEPFDVYG